MSDNMNLGEIDGQSGTPEVETGKPIKTAKELEAVYDIPVQVSAVLGKATMQVSQLLKLGRGAVVELDRTVGVVSEARLLVMIGLLVADELAEAHDELRRVREALVNAEAAARKTTLDSVERRVAPVLDRLATRLDDIAARLEGD